MGTSVKTTESAVDELRDPAYLKIRDMVYNIAGIYQPEEKLYLLALGCTRRMAAVRAKTPAEYFGYLTTRGSREAELRSLLNEITIGETYMFRSAPQLEALRRIVLPQILENKVATGSSHHLQVWSAGCSTGEEPYTLAMFLWEEHRRLLAGWTFEILATDLNDNSLSMAKAGIYGEHALRNTAEPLRKAYFHPCGNDELQVTDQLKSLVRFERVNLHDDGSMKMLQGVDIIFCCNVLIYFDLASKRKVIQHFHSSLSPGGYLFLGHAESLFQIDSRFRLVHFPGTFAYRKPTLDQLTEVKDESQQP